MWVFKCADKWNSVKGGTSELYFLDCSFFPFPLSSSAIVSLHLRKLQFHHQIIHECCFLKDGQLLHGRLVVLTDVSDTV